MVVGVIRMAICINIYKVRLKVRRDIRGPQMKCSPVSEKSIIISS